MNRFRFDQIGSKGIKRDQTWSKLDQMFPPLFSLKITFSLNLHRVCLIATISKLFWENANSYRKYFPLVMNCFGKINILFICYIKISIYVYVNTILKNRLLTPAIFRHLLLSARVSTRNGKILLSLSTFNIKILNTPLPCNVFRFVILIFIHFIYLDRKIISYIN